MTIRSTFCRSVRVVRAQAAGLVLAIAGALLVSLPSAAAAQSTQCGPEVKEYIVKALESVADEPADKKAAFEKELYSQFQYCGANQAAPSTFYIAARECGASITQLGSLFYEEMPCCGYDPQRRQFACPVKIKQTFGFGPNPLPGSREYVLHCVQAPGGGFVPVGRDSVHLSNANPGEQPSWQFAVIAAANQNLGLVQPMNGATRNARSILSWGFEPTDCFFQPIWGNALNYRIRLDQ
jgi:hypothetical protein